MPPHNEVDLQKLNWLKQLLSPQNIAAVEDNLETSLELIPLEPQPFRKENSRIRGLLVREQYLKLYDEVKEEGSCVTGTPGVGKTVFSFYFLLRFVAQKMKNSEEFDIRYGLSTASIAHIMKNGSEVTVEYKEFPKGVSSVAQLVFDKANTDDLWNIFDSETRST